MASTMRFDTWENPTGTLSLDITQARPGLTNIVPASVTVASGTASVNNTGLVTFTAATAINLTNIFTSTYKFYKIIIDSKTSATSEIQGWFTNNGTSITAGWYGAETQAQFSGVVSGAALRSNGNGGWVSYSASANYSNNSQLDLLVDSATNTPQYNVASYSRSAGITFHGGYGTDGAANGFRISPGTGGVTMSGTMQVYGYR